ncbi:Sporangia induced phosphatidyl inositol kinase (PIK-E1) [Plasmopara halstedii]|uniref:Sporangia induced phosphatidyl inositol kinase (PIK-E1) n=1 Tax=Plasmopara halstedii TaxID=4781 RepID=A0A0P1AVV5_PLAHL|nr:Sporangia induced phosphatidyl inositol kinase (PIK-E1) [Plasmopara halstedii]CEG46493.1 Sporangia induced phosphatidyl inositol kinase (PIK-E1) [Plasmopara halstedii]|eukprot:XP_024582862.1 Sporangia induced phosphatidyl inositol kinase (PIK-E1) [Plasmopara halstedii]
MEISGRLADSCSSYCKMTENFKLLDLSSSPQKPALSCLGQSNGSTKSVYASTMSSPSKQLQVSTIETSLSHVKHASLFQELFEFGADDCGQIIMFPDYFSKDEKVMVQEVAQGLHLGCQVGEKCIAVYKIFGGHYHQSQLQRLHSASPANVIIAADDVYVDVNELAQQGKDGFIAKLRLQRMSSRSGIRRNMLWDVAVLSTTADGFADRVSEGEGGVYAVQSRSSGQKLALFKPVEEERFVREGLYAGEGAVREEAAYVLDSRSNGFSGVPPTAVAQLRLSSVGRAKQGAVQRFMSTNIGSMECFGMPFDLEKACEFASVEQIHRIALLDIRVFNTDRHPGNILLIGEKKPYTMVPIDHGCILPSWFHLSEACFDWLKYPQIREPLSNTALQYIESLDAEKDAKLLRVLGIREECVITLKICSLFLKLAATNGKTLYWMGNYMTRDGCFQQPSRLELAIQGACKCVGIPYTFKLNEFDEQHGDIEIGVLSRRPPNEFFLALENLLLDAVKTENF